MLRLLLSQLVRLLLRCFRQMLRLLLRLLLKLIVFLVHVSFVSLRAIFEAERLFSLVTYPFSFVVAVAIVLQL